MNVVNYVYVLPDTISEDGKAMYIGSTLEKRDKTFMNTYNSRTYKDKVNSIKPTGRTAVLYVIGPSEHHSCSRDFTDTAPIPKGVMPVQSQAGFIASKVAARYGADYLSICANTCGASMHALQEAEMLLNSNKFDDVIVYAEDWTDPTQRLLFEKMGITLTCSDGFAILHLQRGEQISTVNWVYHADKNPFFVSKEGYMKAMKPFAEEQIKAVKTHGTQTPNNTEAEYTAIEEMYGDVELIEYKKEIGHTQGVSTAIELCMLLDREEPGKYLVNASGLGNFYGSCTIEV